MPPPCRCGVQYDHFDAHGFGVQPWSHFAWWNVLAVPGFAQLCTPRSESMQMVKFGGLINF